MDIKICETILATYLKENELIFYSVELVKEAGSLILRVILDKKGGITLEDLAKANEYLSERIDKYDSDMPEYMLEVSSRGAERTLDNDEEITDSVGMYIHVEKNDNQIFEGYLEEFIDDNLKVKINLKGRIKRIDIKKQDIKLIRLAVKI